MMGLNVLPSDSSLHLLAGTPPWGKTYFSSYWHQGWPCEVLSPVKCGWKWRVTLGAEAVKAPCPPAITASPPRWGHRGPDRLRPPTGPGHATPGHCWSGKPSRVVSHGTPADSWSESWPIRSAPDTKTWIVLNFKCNHVSCSYNRIATKIRGVEIAEWPSKLFHYLDYSTEPSWHISRQKVLILLLSPHRWKQMRMNLPAFFRGALSHLWSELLMPSLNSRALVTFPLVTIKKHHFVDSPCSCNISLIYSLSLKITL